jgi:hypothetical protein
MVINTALFSKVELGNYITEQMSSVEDDEVDSEIQMFQNALEFLRGERDYEPEQTELVAIELFDLYSRTERIIYRNNI